MFEDTEQKNVYKTIFIHLYNYKDKLHLFMQEVIHNKLPSKYEVCWNDTVFWLGLNEPILKNSYTFLNKCSLCFFRKFLFLGMIFVFITCYIFLFFYVRVLYIIDTYLAIYMYCGEPPNSTGNIFVKKCWIQ